MYDRELNEWRKELQKARKIQRKIDAVQDLREREIRKRKK